MWVVVWICCIFVRFSILFSSFLMETVFFRLLDAKPCRTIMKLPQKVSLGFETCEIAQKVWFLASGFCLLKLGETSAGSWGNPAGVSTAPALLEVV